MGWIRRIAWWGYQSLIGGTMLLAGPVLLARRRQHYWPTLTHRLGFGAQPATSGDRPLWIHAVSVGEVGVAATLAQALPASLPLLVTTVTPTGQAHAHKLFGASGSVQQPSTVTYLPFDLGYPIDRFFRRYSPQGLVLIEGDYWPLVLDFARRRRLPVAVVNGRVGAKAASRQRRIASICRHIFFQPVHLVAAQTERDRQRLLSSGAPDVRLHVTGNLKFDSPPPERKRDLEAKLTAMAADRPILVAGSTMHGEESAFLDAFDVLPSERALLILAPRHPERAAEVLQLARQRGRRTILRSTVEDMVPEAMAPEVIVLDTLGELASLYRLAEIAFIGGTLVPTGGHNPLEPAHFAKPIVVGPSMDNFRAMAEQFDEANAWRRAADPEELAHILIDWLENPDDAQQVGQRAAQLLRDNRGATERTLELIGPLFDL